MQRVRLDSKAISSSFSFFMESRRAIQTVAIACFDSAGQRFPWMYHYLPFRNGTLNLIIQSKWVVFSIDHVLLLLLLLRKEKNRPDFEIFRQ